MVHSHGFTLIEMIVVVAVIAVATGMFVPLVESRVSGARLKDTALRLHGVARYARAFAATRQRPCRLVVDLDEARFDFEVERTGEDGLRAFKPWRADGMRGGQLPKGVKFKDVRLGDETKRSGRGMVVYQPDGSATGAVVRLEGAAGSWTLLVEPWTARSRLVAGRVEDAPVDRIDLDL